MIVHGEWVKQHPEVCHLQVCGAGFRKGASATGRTLRRTSPASACWAAAWSKVTEIHHSHVYRTPPMSNKQAWAGCSLWCALLHVLEYNTSAYAWSVHYFQHQAESRGIAIMILDSKRTFSCAYRFRLATQRAISILIASLTACFCSRFRACSCRLL